MFKQKTKKPTSSKRVSLLAVLAIVVVSSFAVVFDKSDPALAATNSTINFQARLLTAAGNIVPDGQYNVEFKLYNAASGGSSLWTETRTGGNKVRTVNGYLTVNLGSVTTFGSSIDWDQELWLTMNIGGTTVSPSWDGEMNPRLKLTSVPYAFRAGKLVTQNGANTSTLDFTAPTANRTISLPDESGTVCLQSSANCGFALSSGGTNYIQNQFASSQAADFRINGSGRADTAFLSPAIRSVTDSTTGIQLQNAAGSATALTVDTVNSRVGIGASFAPQQALDVVGNFQVRDATTATKGYRFRTDGGGLDLEASGANIYMSVWSGANYTGTQRNYLVLESGANIARAVGTWQFRESAEGATRHTIDGTTGASVSFNQNGEATNFSVQGDTDANLFFLQGSTDRVGIGLNNPSYKLDVAGDINTSTQYRIGGTVICTSAGCTPTAGSGNYIQNGTTLQSGNFYIQSVSPTSVGGIIRGAASQTSSLLQLLDGTSGYTIAQFSNNGYLTLGSDNIVRSGQIVLHDATVGNTYTATIVVPSALTANRTITVPDEAGTICIQGSANCGFAAATGSANYIQNQNTTDQTANLRISGTARANTSLLTPLIDTPTAGALNIGTTNASTINLNKSTVVSGDFNQVGLQPASVAGAGTNGGISSLTAAKGGNTSGTTGQMAGSGGSLYLQGGAGGNAPSGSANGWGGSVIIDGGAPGSGAGSAGFRGNVILQGTAGTVGIGTLAPNSNYKLDVAGDINTSTQYRIGGTVICTSAGCMPTAGSANYIQNQNAGQQTASNFWISGTGRADTSFTTPVLDTPTAVALGIGNTTASGINIGRSGVTTTVTGGLTQSTGAVSLTGNAASSLTTSSGALTLTSAAATTWSTSTGNLSIQAAGTSTLSLTTGGAGTVALGDTNASTINIGRGSNIARTINIGTGGTSTAQAITIGSTGSTSSTTIQGGTGATAINLAPGTNGGINITTTGTGVTLLRSATQVAVRSTVDKQGAFEVQNAAGGFIFSVDTSSGNVDMGFLRVSYPSFGDVLMDTYFGAGDIELGTTMASSVTIGRSGITTTVIGGLTQNTGAVSLTGNAASSFTTTAGALTLTSAAAATWSTTAGNLTLQAATTNTLALTTGGAGTVALGDTNATTINIGRGSDIARTINIGTGGVATAQTITIGSTSSTSSTTIRGGTGATAISLTPGTNGSVNATTTGTGKINLTSASQTVVKSSTNSTTAFQIQNSLNTAILTADTTNARIGINTAAPNVDLDVVGIMQQHGAMTSDTTGADANKWTKLASCSIDNQWTQCFAVLTITGGNNGTDNENTQATVTARVKQQNAMGGAPWVDVSVNGVARVITKDDIKAVTTVNTGGLTTVELWGRITNIYEHWQVAPLINTNQPLVGQYSPWILYSFAGFSAALPAGTQTSATYGTTYADTLTVSPASNTGSVFSVLNASGGNMLTVDSSNGRVIIGRDDGLDGADSRLYFGDVANANNAWIGEANGTDSDILQIQGKNGLYLSVGSSATNVLTFSGTGAATFQNTSNSTTGFRVLTLAGNSLFTVDTLSNLVNVSGTGTGLGGGRLTFGDNSYVYIGEYGGGDTDAMRIHGEEDIYITTKYSATAMVYLDGGTGRVGINTQAPSETLTISGNANIVATDSSKAYRWRTTGSSLDFEAGGASLYLSTWTNVGMTTSQRQHIVMNTSGTMSFNSIATISSNQGTLCINTSSKSVQYHTGTSCSVSSLRYKKNVQDMADSMGLETINAMRPVTYEFKEGDGSQKVGFIAEEMVEILPQVVNYDDQGRVNGIDYEFLTANIVKGMQQQQVQINNLREGLWSGGIVSNDATFNSLVTFNGDVVFKGKATFDGKVSVNGKITYSPDTAGSIVIPEGKTSATITFAQAYDLIPQITVSPSDFVSLKVTDKTETGFTVTMRYAANHDVTIDWVATQVAQPKEDGSDAPTVVINEP